MNDVLEILNKMNVRSKVVAVFITFNVSAYSHSVSCTEPLVSILISKTSQSLIFKNSSLKEIRLII